MLSRDDRLSRRGAFIDSRLFTTPEISLDEEIVMMEDELKDFRTGTKSSEHKVVKESDLVNYLDEGWQIVREMNDAGKFMVKRS